MTPAWAVDVAGNGGFEDAGGGGATDSDLWAEFAGGAAGTLSERDAGNPATGSWAHHVLAIGSDAVGASAGLTQNSLDVGPSLEENTTVSASLDHNTDLGPGGVGFYSLRVLNGVGAIVADTGLQPLPATGGAYQTLPTNSVNVPAFGPAPNDEYAAFLELVVISGAFDGSTAESFFDNVSIEATLIDVPAVPTSSGWGLIVMALLLVAAVMVVFARTRQAHSA